MIEIHVLMEYMVIGELRLRRKKKIVEFKRIYEKEYRGNECQSVDICNSLVIMFCLISDADHCTSDYIT